MNWFRRLRGYRATARLLVLFAGSCVFSSPSWVAAQAVSPEDDARARELYQLGDRLYSRGQYEGAYDAFQEAYELSHRPALLFNVANALERAGRLQEARTNLQEYLPHATEEQRSDVESRIRSLEVRIEREEAEAERERLAQEAALEEERRRQEEARLLAGDREDEGGSLAGPLLLAGAGATLAGGIVAALIANGARSDLEEACNEGICPASAEALERRDLAASVSADGLFVLTGVLATVGVILIATSGGDDEDEPAVEAGIGVLPGGAALQVGGHF